jgi:branched-subunit amino acid transport protein
VDDVTAWAVIIIVGIATFAMRFVFIALFGKVGIPGWLETSLRYVAPSVLAAIAVPAVVAPGGIVSLWSPLLPAAIIGAFAAWLTKSIGAAILFGMVALWLIQWVG